MRLLRTCCYQGGNRGRAVGIRAARRVAIARDASHISRMIDKAFVPPDTVGWMVRVKTPPSMEEFYLAAIPDEAAAVKAVRTRIGPLANQTVEGVATLSEIELRAQNLRPGQIEHA